MEAMERRGGILKSDGNLIQVREAISKAAMERYTVDNYALEANFIRKNEVFSSQSKKKMGPLSTEMERKEAETEQIKIQDEAMVK